MVQEGYPARVSVGNIRPTGFGRYSSLKRGESLAHEIQDVADNCRIRQSNRFGNCRHDSEQLEPRVHLVMSVRYHIYRASKLHNNVLEIR